MKNRTVSDLIKDLEEIKAIHGDLPLIYAKDDEGNDFDYVFFSPTPGYFDDDACEFIDDVEDFNSMRDEDDKELTINAVCVN